jgi:excisionase family DNA binding protein
MSELKAPTAEADEILTDETTATLLGVEPRTIREWRATRGLPFIRITPKVIRIRRPDLNKWLAKHQVAMMRGAQ